MKEKSKSLSQSLFCVRLRRSEVRELANILKAGDGSLSVESDTHTFETVEELLASSGPMEHIQFQRDNPDVSVNIGSACVHVYASSDDLVSAGLVSRLVEFAKSHRGLMYFWLRWHPVLAGLLVGGLTLVALSVLGRPWSKRLFVSTLVACAVIMLWSFYLHFLRGVAPIKFRGDGVPVHWRGAAWDVVKIVLAALVGAFVTLSIQRCRIAPSSIPQPPTAAAVSPAVDAGTAR